MNVTHCPECTTAFKVSTEQLALANGWVRCGRCGAVFEAEKNVASTNLTESLEAPASSKEAQLDMQRSEPSPQLRSTLSPSLAPLVASTGVGWWVGVSSVLLLVLLWQMVLSHRHVLAAEEPDLKSLLQALCAPVLCKVTWPQEPDALRIENSSFHEDAQGGYTLQLRIKNSQHHPVATPYLELNLTDLQDQVVVRRVFSIQEMAQKDHIAALRDARVSLHFELDPKLSEQVSGFRALIFYP
jgi:predicted Zn finger-like uncharacterized protein